MSINGIVHRCLPEALVRDDVSVSRDELLVALDVIVGYVESGSCKLIVALISVVSLTATTIYLTVPC